MKNKKILVLILTLVISLSFAFEVSAKTPQNLTFKVIDRDITEIYGGMKDGKITISKMALYNSDGSIQSYAYTVEPQKNKIEGNERATSINPTTDYGYTYLMQNGYPNRSYGYGDNGDYYVTQLAVWMYAYKVYGVKEDDKIVGYLIDTNGDKDFHFTGASTTSNRQTKIANSAYDLYRAALKAHTDGKDSKNYKLSHSVSTNDLSVVDGKLESKPVTVTLEGAREYQVSFNIKNVVAVSSESGNVKDEFRVEEKFIVRYLGDVKDFNVKATITAKDPNVVVYEVKPEGNKQGTISSFLDSDGSNLSDEVSFRYQANRTTIALEDSNSGKPISGATLIIKDLHNSRVDSWVSTTEPHYVVLSPGSYTLEETIAPKGYALQTNNIQFTVKGDGTDKVTMLNTPLGGIDISNLADGGEEELAGATLVIKDNDGKEVATWTTTESKYHIVLEPGEYTLVETVVPSEYVLNKKTVTFTVLADGTVSTPVVMTNELKPIPVPITGSVRSVVVIIASLLLVICGTLIFYEGYRKRRFG